MTVSIVTVLGARPQFVKAAVVSRALRERGGIEETIVHTGQHHDTMMSEVFFSELEIPAPSINLGVAGGSHGEQTGRMLPALEQALNERRPDWVMVYGDTNSTLAGALVAAKLGVPVAHVEAGLRSFNRMMPEEINRVVADQLSKQLFTPTDVGTANLVREGHDRSTISQVGDVMYDATLLFTERARRNSDVLERFTVRPREFVLATVHRQENVDAPARLRRILMALADLAKDIRVVLPLHPRARNVLRADGDLSKAVGGVTITDPVGYLDMLALERAARLIVTDSGGVQKEAFFQGVPCVTLRAETEWTELVECGWNVLAPPMGDTDVVATARRVMNMDFTTRPRPDFYGAGDARERIATFFAGRS